MRTIDLLRNHTWNMQALITQELSQDERGFFDTPANARFHVRVEPIHGFGLVRTTIHETIDAARKHALTVLGMDGLR